MTRAEAIAAGLKHYDPVKVCKRGHDSQRFVSTFQCVECQRYHGRRPENVEKRKPYKKAYDEANKARNKTYRKDYYAAHPEKSREWAAKNRERSRAIKARWAERNKEQREAYLAKYRRSDLNKANQKRYVSTLKGHAKRNALARKRFISRMQRTPAWANTMEIERFYRQAALMRRCGIDCHVDHIVPLQGDVVSGLHVETNLQILPGAENIRKRNKWTTD